MTTKVFHIEGENVKDVGMRPALLDKALDYDVSVHATNHPNENRVKVIVNGDNESIDEFVEFIRNEDIRIKKADIQIKNTLKMYTLTRLEEYDGPEIDWERYEIRFMSRQMTKGFREAVERLSSIEFEINKLSKIKP
jgi:acylphosphatase